MSFFEKLQGTLGQSGVAGGIATVASVAYFGQKSVIDLSTIGQNDVSLPLVIGGAVALGSAWGDLIGEGLSTIPLLDSQAAAIQNNAPVITSMIAIGALNPQSMMKPKNLVTVAVIAYVSNLVANKIVTGGFSADNGVADESYGTNDGVAAE